MIVSFGNKATEHIYHGEESKQSRRVPENVSGIALRKLDMLNSAASLDDLKAPPGNRLEKLRGNLEGFHSMRINDQYRLIFKMEKGNAYEVQIIDYH